MRAQYVNLSGNSGTFNTVCYFTNVSDTALTLEQVYILGPGGITSTLATYTGLVGAVVQPGGQVQLPINSVTIPGGAAETAVDGNGVKSVALTYVGVDGGLDVTATIERNDGGTLSGRAYVSLVGVPVIL